MNTNTSPSGTPQFTTAEFAGKASTPSCQSCGQPLQGNFYRVNGAPVCAACTQRVQRTLPQDSHAAFVRGVLFGAVAAVAGFALYVVFALSTGLVIGFVSLAVGFMVGKAIALGSRGVGGRRYQIAAVVLTYMAVSLSAVPIAIYWHMQHRGAAPQAGVTAGADSAATVAPTPAPPRPSGSAVKAIGTLVALGLASPFLDLKDPAHGFIGLIILLVGLRIAWRLTAARAPKITGPIALSAPAAAG
jgi:hypothetical protein